MIPSNVLHRISEFVQKKTIDSLVAEDLRNYVYALYAPGEKFPFYVGKGVGERVLHHFAETIIELSRTSASTIDSMKLRSIIDSFDRSDSEPQIRIIRRNLDEDQAEAVEGALIDVLQPPGNKVRGLHSVQNGMISLDELIIEKGAKPLAPKTDYGRIYLFNIEKGHAERKSYDIALRGHWKSNRFIRDLAKYRAGGGRAFAVGLIRGISRHVIEVESWQPSEFGPDRFQMVGPEVADADLLHKRWSQVIKESGFWKRGNGLVVELTRDLGRSGFRILHGEKQVRFRPFE
ncbi:LEM-3-like GIY-YIG domain-containing protein [Luteolibacter soli]|uniref:GIY-YIG nuclease family protein n=1 Tax=Luteolibacter soli TaxID=3135280 RepID=A0ABU9B4K7_9BACT